MFAKVHQLQTSTPQSVKIPISCGAREAFTDISLISSSNIIKEELDIIDDHYIKEEPIPMSHDICEVLLSGQAANTVLDYDFIKEQPCLEYNEDNQEDLKDPLFIGQIEDEEVQCNNEPSNSPTTRHQITSENVRFKKQNKQEEEEEEEEEGEEQDEEYEEVSHSTENDEILLSQLQLKKLENLTIQFQHVVPPQHLLEQRTIGRCTPRSEIKEFEKYCKMKKGIFSPVEDAILIKNWKMFCQVHDWDEEVVRPFLRTKYGGRFYIKRKEQRHNFLRFLANGLPWRSLFSVFTRFRALFHDYKNGKYSPSEDEQILNFMDENRETDNELTWVTLGQKMNRHPKSIAKRYSRLIKLTNSKVPKKHNSSFQSGKDKKLSKSSIIITKNAPNVKKVKMNTVEKFVTWSPQLVTTFIENLLKVSMVEDLKKLKNLEIHSAVWIQLEKLMKIDKRVLENFWNLRLHMQLFSSSPIYLDDLKIALIQFFSQSDFHHFEDIIWKEVCEHFDGITVHFLKKLWNHLLGYAQSKITSTDYNDLVNYLCLMHIPEIKKNATEAFLPQLYYKKNNLILFDKGTEKEIPGLISADPLNIDDDAETNDNTERDDNIERDDSDLQSFFETRRNKSTTFNTKKCELKTNKIKTSVDWDLNLAQTFIDHLLKYTSSNFNALKNKTVPEDVWLKIQCSMRISKLALQEFWYLRLHLQLFSPTPVHLSQLQIDLIELLHDSNINNINDIVWEEICLKFEGSTAQFLSKLCDSLIQQALIKINSDNFKELLNYLYTKYVVELEENITDVVLPALHCENGKIVSVMVEAERIEGNTTHDPFINTVLEV